MSVPVPVPVFVTKQPLNPTNRGSNPPLRSRSLARSRPRWPPTCRDISLLPASLLSPEEARRMSANRKINIGADLSRSTPSPAHCYREMPGLKVFFFSLFFSQFLFPLLVSVCFFFVPMCGLSRALSFRRRTWVAMFIAIPSMGIKTKTKETKQATPAAIGREGTQARVGQRTAAIRSLQEGPHNSVLGFCTGGAREFKSGGSCRGGLGRSPP